jgi:hypothetical protein
MEPKLVNQNKYDKLVFSGLREDRNLSVVASPQAYFRGASQIPGAGINLGWQLITKAFQLETEPHTHRADEYLVFLGHDTADFFSSFDAHIELFLGTEMEKHSITKPTIVYIPSGFSHCPLEFKVVNEPVLFTALLQEPSFSKTMNGKEYIWKEPEAKGAVK